MTKLIQETASQASCIACASAAAKFVKIAATLHTGKSALTLRADLSIADPPLQNGSALSGCIAHLVKDMVCTVLVLKHAIGIIDPACGPCDVKFGLQEVSLLPRNPSNSILYTNQSSFRKRLSQHCGIKYGPLDLLSSAASPCQRKPSQHSTAPWKVFHWSPARRQQSVVRVVTFRATT